jgi:hypothetical protein
MAALAGRFIIRSVPSLSDHEQQLTLIRTVAQLYLFDPRALSADLPPD